MLETTRETRIFRFIFISQITLHLDIAIFSTLYYIGCPLSHYRLFTILLLVRLKWTSFSLDVKDLKSIRLQNKNIFTAYLLKFIENNNHERKILNFISIYHFEF